MTYTHYCMKYCGRIHVYLTLIHRLIPNPAIVTPVKDMLCLLYRIWIMHHIYLKGNTNISNISIQAEHTTSHTCTFAWIFYPHSLLIHMVVWLFNCIQYASSSMNICKVEPPSYCEKGMSPGTYILECIFICFYLCLQFPKSLSRRQMWM